MGGFTMVVVILVASAAAALLLRWARLPGWPVAGGVLAGLILGPTILGRVLPQSFEKLFVGGAEERRTLDLQELLAAEAEATGGDASDAVAEAREALREARHRHQKPLRDLAALAAAVVLAAGGARRGQKPSSGPVSALSIGAWSAAVPGALALAAARWLWSWGWPESMLVAAAVAIGPWRLGHSDREAAERAEVEGGRLIEAAGCVASAVALVACAWALRSGGGYPALAAGWPLLGVLASWVLPFGGGRWVGVALRALLVPALAASATIRVDLLGDFRFWPVVVVMIVCGDGRWLGALLGALVLGERRGLRTMRLVLGSMAAGTTQLAVVAVGLNSGLLQAAPALALILGASLIEVTAPVRRSMSRRLIETEEALEELEERD